MRAPLSSLPCLVQRLGSQYVVGLRAKNCRTGEVLDEEQAQAAREEDVLNALSQISTKFRTRVGESLTSVKKYDIPLEEATTPSLEALKTYSAGWKTDISAQHDPTAAVALFKRAIEIAGPMPVLLDTRGMVYLSMGLADLAKSDLEEAVQGQPTATRCFHLAQAYQAARDRLAAASTWRKARALGLKVETLSQIERPAFQRLLEEFEPK